LVPGQVDAHKLSADGDRFANVAVRTQYTADVTAGDRDRRFVGHHVDERLIDLNLLPRPNVPGDDFCLDDTFTQVGQFEDNVLHDSD
jgi:hypothetical protein